ncbi:hypothetical protein VHUM_01220 [Vanrija humicola]|uniref:Uncharacterized protein n=1 Tax=Vanrija humicola TaxID=5417 RepID=A0A7D8V2Q8_VANHU|nr:hypothetical protein VHUM_01220 [Vanrija humicola]
MLLRRSGRHPGPDQPLRLCAVPRHGAAHRPHRRRREMQLQRREIRAPGARGRGAAGRGHGRLLEGVGRAHGARAGELARVSAVLDWRVCFDSWCVGVGVWVWCGCARECGLTSQCMTRMYRVCAAVMGTDGRRWSPQG